MRSTRVEQKVHASFTYLLKPSSSPHWSAYWLTHFKSSLPLLSMSSQDRMTSPPLPACQRL